MIQRIFDSTLYVPGVGHSDQCYRAGGIRLPAEHPALANAASWLGEKELRLRGDWAVNNPHPEPSGWAFEYNNVYYPDTDDTAMVPWPCAGDGRAIRMRWANSSARSCLAVE